ncbi:MAG: class I SAM-dependent methyltransferase [Variovorax sp.]|jgi:SAM-dependent methyltransferase
MDLPSESPVRLNIGCGAKRLEGYIGVDLVPEADVQADVRALPFPDGHADEILAVHVFEHLYRWESPAALAEWMRVLKPGGRLVLELPDILKVARYILTSEDQRLGLWGAYGDPGYREPLMAHKWGWSASELGCELRAAGFVKVKEKPVQFHKPQRDMRLEARKP